MSTIIEWDIAKDLESATLSISDTVERHGRPTLRLPNLDGGESDRESPFCFGCTEVSSLLWLKQPLHTFIGGYF